MAETAPLPDVRVDEIRRQLDVLVREKWPRILLTNLAFALSTVFLPVWVALVAAAVNLVFEFAGMHLMQGLDPGKSKQSYYLSILSVFVMESGYAITAGLVWTQHAPHAQSFALGMVLVTMIHLTTVRSIHLPYGIAGTLAVVLAILVSNTTYWIGLGDWNGLVISTICAIGGVAYMLTAMISNNNLHRISARGEAAAQAADLEKSRFLARMSHELRTPLNAIIGFGIVERDRAHAAESRARLATLVDSAQGLATMLDDLLDLAAINAGRFPLRERDFDLRAEFAKITALFAEQFRETGIALDTRIAPAVPQWLRLDPQRMRQCVTNLLSNTLRHSGARHVAITVDVQPRPVIDGRLVLQIVVEDDGEGIEEAERSRVFEPYRQGRDAQAGSGLGLSICRTIARQMGGEVELLATARGAAFKLTLAAAEADPPETACEAAPMPDLTGRTVLIVDDIPTNRLVAAAYLASSGARIVEAGSGEAALRVMEEEEIELVLLDMNMPRMDGLETFRQMRRSFSTATRIPIVAMTADAAGDQRRQYLAQGLDDHLAKPLDPAVMAEVIRRHLVLDA